MSFPREAIFVCVLLVGVGALAGRPRHAFPTMQVTVKHGRISGGSCRIHGIVRDKCGAIAPMNEVAIYPLGSSSSMTVRSNEKGEYTVDLAPGPHQVSASTRVGSVCQWNCHARLDLRAGDDARVDLVSSKTASLKGIVHDASGRGIPAALELPSGANASEDGREEATETDGRFRIPAFEGSTRISIFAPGWARKRLMAPLVGGATYTLDVTLAPEAVIEGNVVDVDGKAVPCSTVCVFQGTDRVELSTDEDGRFSTAGQGLSPGRALLVARTQGESEMGAQLTVSLQPGKTKRDLTVHALPVLELHLIDLDGQPVTGVYPCLRSPTGVFLVSLGEHSDEPGVYGGEVDEGPAELVFNRGNGQESVAPIVIGPGKNVVRFPLPTHARGARISGTVVTPRPARMSWLELHGCGVKDFAWAQNGAFSFDALPEGDFEIDFQSYDPGFIARRVVTLGPGQDLSGVTLDAHPGASLRGVLIGRRGTPVSSARLQLVRTDRFARPESPMQTDADGTFRRSTLEPGSYRIEPLEPELIAAEVGGTLAPVELTVAEGELIELRLEAK